MNVLDRMHYQIRNSKPTTFKYYMLRLISWWQKVNPFNYRVFIYNKRTLCHSNSAAKIGYDGKYFFLLQDNGQPFRVQTAMTIYDAVNKPYTR